MLLYPPGQGHTIAWRPTSGPGDCSIDVSAQDAIRCQSDEGQELIFARFTCPYCWTEGSFVEAIPNDKYLVIVCEQVQREFAITVK